MNLNDMMIFAEVVEREGFTAAGRALGMPKSNVSRTVSRLEASLQVQLLERTTRRQTLTEVGRIYYEHCSRIKEEMQSASASIENLTAAPVGKLRVCASVSVGQSLIAPHLAQFARTYPEVTVDLRLTNRRVDLIDEGYDVVVRVGESPDSNLISKYLCSQELHLYAAPAYRKANSAALVEPEDLHVHHCLFMTAMSERPQWRLSKGEVSRVVNFEPTFSCDDFRVLQQIAIDGFGVAKLPAYMCREAVLSGQLTRVLDDWMGAEVDIHALVPSRRGVTPKIRAFLDHLARSSGAK